VIARLASRNEHKLRELRALLPQWELELLDEEYPPETGATYYENARAKALFARTLTHLPVLGEDSGIEVGALGGRPGIESARWASDGVAALLQELDGVEERAARYMCELVLLATDGDEVRGTGVLDGRIGREPRGAEGFGYDPIFIPQGETRTVAELGNEWKREYSHRARAAKALLAKVS